VDITGALTASTSLNIASSTTVDGILDEDNMASNSATKLATQQSIKAYVDAQVGTVDTLAEVLGNGNTTGGTDIVVSANDVISLDAGTNALPSLTTTGDLNTGLYFPAADEVGITTGGTQRVKVDSTGVDITGTLTSDGLTIDGGTGNYGIEIEARTDFTGISGQLGITDSTGSAILTTVSGNLNVSTGATFGTNTGAQRLQIGSGGDISFYEDTGTTAKLFWDASAESLGIGTSSPSQKLDISAGYLNFSNGYGIRWGGNTTEAIYGNNTGNLIGFQTNGSERMRIDSNGRVILGGGSTVGDATADNLTVGQGAGDEGVTIYSSATGYGSLFFKDSGANFDGYVQYKHNDNFLRFGTATAERMRIDSSGSVGIGTTSPSLNASYDRTIHIHSTLGSLIKLTDATSGTTDADGTELINYGNDTYLVNRDAGNTIFGTSGSERMRIDSSGNVGIGTSSPDTALHVAGKSTVRNTIVSNFTLDGGVQVPNPYDGFGFGIDFIGRDYGNAVRDYAYIYSVMEASGSSAGGGDASFKAGLRFYTNGGGASGTIPTERMRIDSSGNLLVNTIASQSGLAKAAIEFDSGSQYGLEIKDAGSGTTGTLGIFYRGTTAVGSISTNGSTTAYNTSSDYRLKENVVELTGATTRLKQLDPKRFNFIADDTTTVDGFLAHEVQSVVPEAITGIHNEVDADGNPVYQGIDQSKLVPLLVATIKELEARITALENT